MERGYSIVTFKTVEAGEQRLILGTASTPETDRVGDIVESLGITFRNPAPLLLHHDSTKPVGTVTFDAPTKRGLTFQAKFPQIKEPGALRDRVEEAWQSIRAGLIKGVSIGFRALDEGIEVMKGGGLRFTKTEVLELSLVAVPANASATITAIKSAAQRAQSGARYSRPSDQPSASAAATGPTRTKGPTMVPISEQVTSALTELKTKNDRLAELDELDGADGGLEDAQVTERDTLTKDVQTLAGKVERLKAREIAAAQLARTAVAKTQTDVREPVTRVIMGDGPEKKLPPGVEFARAIICRAAGVKMGVSAIDLAKHYYPDFPRIQQFLKEAVPAGSTLDSTWAGPLVYPQNLVSEFVEFLRDMTIIGKIEGFTRVPFNSRFTGQTSGGTGYWVGQGKAKPLTKFDYNEITVPFTKVANITVLTEELIRFSNPSAEINVRNQLARACQERLDIDFIDPSVTAQTGIRPQSITNGVAHIDSSGVTLDAVDTDVQALMTAFINAKILPTHWIMPQTVALALSLMRTALGNYAFPTITMSGGTFYGLPVITSQYAILGTPANNLIILLSAPEILMADDGGFQIDISREASLEMDDAPTMDAGSLGSPAGATGSVVVSMFQTNSAAVRCERFIYWARRRSGTTAGAAGVAWMDDVQWAAGTQ